MKTKKALFRNEKGPFNIPRRGIAPRTSCQFRLRAKRTKTSRYPLKLSTIGDHVRKRRLDLGLEQKDVARTLGVSAWTISNWETKSVEPETRLIPKVIGFLGYVPFERGETLGERIAIYRKTLGLNHTQFAKKLGVARCTVFGWEHDQVKNVEKKIRPYLNGVVQFD